MFPISASGIVRIEAHTVNTDAVLTALRERFISFKPSSVIVRNNRLSFRAGIFRLVLSTNVLLQFDHGHIDVTKAGHLIVITYDVSFIEMLVVGTVLVAVFAYILPPSSLTWLLFGFAWAWLIGGNYLLGVLRFRSMIKEVVRQLSITSKA